MPIVPSVCKRRNEQWGVTCHIADAGTIWSAQMLTLWGKLLKRLQIPSLFANIAK